MPTEVPALTFIMERDASNSTGFSMWACRGEGKGCQRNRHRENKKHCEDCLATRNDETLGDVMERIKRGES